MSTISNKYSIILINTVFLTNTNTILDDRVIILNAGIIVVLNKSLVLKLHDSIKICYTERKSKSTSSSKNHSLRKKCPSTEVFPGPYFPSFGLNTERYSPYFSIFSPNAGKYGPEKTLYLDTFHAVTVLQKQPSRGFLSKRCFENIQ